MADFKIDAKTYSFGKLETEFKGMNGPAFKIEVEGQDLTGKHHMAISDVIAETSVEAADLCSFTVTNGYNYPDRCFNWLDIVKVGKKISVKMGYVDVLATVFEGYITQVTLDFSEGSAPLMRVSAMDGSFMLMKGRKTRLWLQKKHSEIASEIAGKYGLAKAVKDTPIKYDTVDQSGEDGQSDYEFLQYMADVNGYEFFVSGYTLYFRPLNSEKTEIAELTIGADLEGFSVTTDIGAQVGGVVVNGFSAKPENITGKATAIVKLGSGKTDGTAEVAKLNKDETMVEIHGPVVDQKEAENWAKGCLNRVGMKYVQGYGSIKGIPYFRAGRHIKIKGFWKDGGRTLYLNSVKHVIDVAGYITYFTVEGNAI